MPVNLRNRHLISLKHHTPAEIEYLLDLAADLKNKKRAGIKGNLLERKNVALIFEKPSTRTRCAFTVAAIDEGGHPEYLGKNDIQLGHKEDVADTRIQPEGSRRPCEVRRCPRMERPHRRLSPDAGPRRLPHDS